MEEDVRKKTPSVLSDQFQKDKCITQVSLLGKTVNQMKKLPIFGAELKINSTEHLIHLLTIISDFYQNIGKAMLRL